LKKNPFMLGLSTHVPLFSAAYYDEGQAPVILRLIDAQSPG
jgi:hypothetical protein